MANPTTNYGFVLPTATDLVTDLPADFDVALQGVDTRLKALQPGTTLGDLAYSSATANTNTRLGIGTSGQVLAVSGGGVPAWTTTADVTPLTTKGDLFTFTTVDARLGVGANNTVLTADSAEATGLKWATPAGGGLKSFTLLNSGGTALTGAQTITVSSISNQQAIMVRISGASSASASSRIFIRINGDTASNYTFSGVRATAAANVLENSTDYGIPFGQMSDNVGSVVSGMATILGTSSASGIFGVSSNGMGNAATGTGQIGFSLHSIYSASAAVTSISVFSETGNFDAGTLFVYGMAA